MKPSIPKGTRDFGPEEMIRRDYIFSSIKAVFQKYGFLPIETPAMENLSTLLGKYGEEGDKLLFKILNSGDFLSKTDAGIRNDSISLAPAISEKGLRYDLTVPFARFVVQHQNDLTFPFKRYQIQPVWRADKPQKGRYREFYQCDVDVIGSKSLLNEVELIQIINEVFGILKLNVCLKLNNRKILYGIAEAMNATDNFMDITVAIDKLEKIGSKGVLDELKAKGIADKSIEVMTPILEFSGNNADKLALLKQKIGSSETGAKGIEEMETIFNYLADMHLDIEIDIDLTLARGLNYYTGSIFEVKAKDVQIGSICGGGRYDDLTGIFGLQGMSGVGISFGADRIYDVLEQLSAFPNEAAQSTQVLFVNFGEKETKYCLSILADLRKSGVKAEMYPDVAKMKKQFSYADSRKIPFVIIAGENEIQTGQVTLKNMNTGQQSTVAKESILKEVSDKY